MGKVYCTLRNFTCLDSTMYSICNWYRFQYYLFIHSGSRTGEVHIHDVRKPQHCMSQLKSHSLEVCGLQWSPDRRHLASGGNDNVVCVWDPSASDTPLQTLIGHRAAVKV